MSEVDIKLCSSYEEILQIKSLQNLNLKCNIGETEAKAEGFVTAIYSCDFLKVMSDSTPAILATNNGVVVGYLLAVNRDTALKHDLLKKIVIVSDEVILKYPTLANTNYIIVGQLCIDKEYRGLGLVNRMYELYYETYHVQYNYCITDIAVNNPRSMKAHLKCGFKAMERLDHGGELFDLVIWDWDKLLT